MVVPSNLIHGAFNQPKSSIQTPRTRQSPVVKTHPAAKKRKEKEKKKKPAALSIPCLIIISTDSPFLLVVSCSPPSGGGHFRRDSVQGCHLSSLFVPCFHPYSSLFASSSSPLSSGGHPRWNAASTHDLPLFPLALVCPSIYCICIRRLVVWCPRSELGLNSYVTI